MKKCRVCGGEVRTSCKIRIGERTWSKTKTETCQQCGSKFRDILRGRRKPGNALKDAVQVAKLEEEA